eukprot:15467701-Alexandrium_andersonii.AAC.1
MKSPVRALPLFGPRLTGGLSSPPVRARGGAGIVASTGACSRGMGSRPRPGSTSERSSATIILSSLISG